MEESAGSVPVLNLSPPFCGGPGSGSASPDVGLGSEVSRARAVRWVDPLKLRTAALL